MNSFPIKASVISPSVRPGGLKLVEKALNQQTFRDFEWLVNDKRYDGGFWGLNRAYNQLIDQASGELIVSWQDYTFAKPDALERFVENYKKTGGIISGIGNKYVDDSWVEKNWQDPRQRIDMGSFYECNPNDVEWNFCACPKKALMEVGGFDEEMDFLGFGMDGISVNERMDSLGYKFYLDQSNESYSINHNRPDNWDEFNLLNGGYLKRKQELIKEGQWPTLNYLKKNKN